MKGRKAALGAVLALAMAVGLTACGLGGPQGSGPAGTTPAPEESLGPEDFRSAPEGQALAEWRAFLASYDSDGVLLATAGKDPDPALAQYRCYTVYTREMADELEAIAARYGLALHTGRVDPSAHPELLGELASFAPAEGEAHWTALYEDGSCSFDGSVATEEGRVEVQFLRLVKGTLHEVSPAGAEDWLQWNYLHPSGVETVLALGEEGSLLFARLPDSYVLLSVLAGTGQGMTEEGLRALADRYDLSRLTPAERPQLPDETRSAFGVVLRNLLYGDTLPDGTRADVIGELAENRFAVADVDGDGREELVVLYSTSTMAGMGGFVVGCDPVTGEVHLELVEFPAFTFYDNGIVKVDSSHNQTFGAMWPYALFVYNGETDSYDWLASAQADDRAAMEQAGKGADYPAQADTSGSGTVYTMIFADDPNTEVLWDKTEYDPWLAETLGDGRPLELTYESLTAENIAAMERG